MSEPPDRSGQRDGADAAAPDAAERAAGHSSADQPTAGEYALGGLGLAVVVALLLFLGYQAVSARDGGAELAAAVTGISRVQGGWQVDFEVTNGGGEAAEEVQITGTVTSPDGSTARASAVLARVPAGSSRAGALLFVTDPRAGRLDVRPEGYATP